MPSVGIIGAGTMGAGIAQIAATAGWDVKLMDVDRDRVENAIAGVKKRFDRNVEKGRMDAASRDAAAARLDVAACPKCFAACDLVIEAISEDLALKTKVLGEIVPELKPDAIIATNTSSLSVTELGQQIGETTRTLGMHFFNPAPLMQLVEVIAGRETDRAHVTRATAIAASWGKQVARAADIPGFIVNHVARPYYLEAFRILEDGFADPAEIDCAMKDIGGFRMGPFELTDLIGQDVNTATSRSVWEQLGQPPLLRPNALQESLVTAGNLGRKSGQGVYNYAEIPPEAVINFTPNPMPDAAGLRAAVEAFVVGAGVPRGDAVSEYVFARILLAVITQAELAHERGVAEHDDIDTAMRYGVNYPRGPFEWSSKIGANACTTLRAALGAHHSMTD